MHQGVLESVALHIEDAAADRELMAYIGAPPGTTYEEWCTMRDGEAEPAEWYEDYYEDSRIVEAQPCFDLRACPSH